MKKALPVGFVVTMLAVLAGNSNQEQLASLGFYLRFAAYGGLIVLALTIPRTGPTAGPLTVFLVGAIAFLALGSTLWSVTPALTLQRAFGFCLLLGAMALAVRACLDPRSMRSMLSGVCVAILMFQVAGLIATLLGYSEASEATRTVGFFRFQGLLVSPNSVGVVAAIFLPVALGLRMTASTRYGWSWNVWLAVVGLSLILSQSRGGIVAAAVGLTAFFWSRLQVMRKTRVVASAAGVLMLISLAIIVPELQPSEVRSLSARFTSQYEGSAEGSGRFAAWGLATDIWEERPLTGWGFGSGEEVFGAREHEIEQSFQGRDPHNSYFHTLMELGPVGLLLLLSLSLFALVLGWKVRRDKIGAALFAGLVASFTVSLFESGLTSPGSILGFSTWMLFFLLLGLNSHLHRSRYALRVGGVPELAESV